MTSYTTSALNTRDFYPVLGEINLGEIRFVGTGKTRGYRYLVCKKEVSSTAKNRTNCLICKKSLTAKDYKYTLNHHGKLCDVYNSEYGTTV